MLIFRRPWIGLASGCLAVGLCPFYSIEERNHSFYCSSERLFKMWWNIIPSWVITGSCLYIPVVATLGSSYFWLGSIYGRERDSDLHRFLIFRDKRILNGANPYRQHKHLGLDGIPDN